MIKQNYAQFYKKQGIRVVGQLTNPPINQYQYLVLPKNTAIHFPQYDESEEVGIPQNHFLLQHVKKNMYGKIYTEYNAPTLFGDFRNNPINLDIPIREYYMSNRRILRFEGNPTNDENTIVFYSYGMINNRYKYPIVRKDTDMNRWLNYWESVFTYVNEAINTDKRNHFIILDVPTMFPAIDKLKEYVNKSWDMKTAHYFRNESHWLILSLFKLFNGVRDSKLNPIFSSLTDESIKRLNIIFKHNNVYTVINLHTVLQFNKAYNAVAPIDPIKYSKLFLNMFIVLKESVSISEDNTEEIAEDSKDNVEYLDDTSDDGDDDEVDDPIMKRRKEEERIKELYPKNLQFMFGDSDTEEQKEVRTKMVVAKDGSIISDDDEEEDELGISDDELDAKLLIAGTISEEQDSEEFDTDEFVYKTYEELHPDTTPEDSAVLVAKTQAKNGLLSAGEVRRAEKLANEYKKIKNPYDNSKPFTDLLHVDKEEMKLEYGNSIVPENIEELIPDKDMTHARLINFDTKYVNNVLPKHVAQSIMMITKMGVTIQAYEIDRVKNINDDFDIHTVRVTTVAGKQSTIRFRLPRVDANGNFRVNGVESRMRKQWNDIPIRKIAPSIVSLTSYYSKLFVRRTERAAFNYETWLMNIIVSKGIDGEDNSITDVKLNDVFDSYQYLPRAYTIIAKRIASFDAKGYHFNFDYSKIEEIFKNHKVTNTKIPVAKHLKTGSILEMDKSSGLLITSNGEVTLEEFLGIDTTNAPIDYAEVEIYGKALPIVIVLAYYTGLGNLLKTLKVKYIRKDKVTEAEMKLFVVVKFKGEYLLIDKKDETACLIINGLNRFKNDVRKRSMYDFDSRDIYANIFENNGIELRYLKELQTMFLLWVDHITKDILLEMKEPTELYPLLIRAVELLLTDHHPHSMDTGFMRIRGYERFSGFLYSELAKAAREYNWKPNRKDKAFTLHPDAVWYSILNDESTIMTECSNPVHFLKEQEIVVYRGQGGRNSDTMLGKARKFHPSAMGVVSEATVDSKDTGTIVYLSPDSSLDSLYGTKDEHAELKSSNIMSTTMLLLPGGDIDDPKRTGFTAVQNSQTMPVVGYSLLPVRTGYERILPARTSEVFCKVADDDGEVVDIAYDVLIVKYKDGTEGKYKIGTTFAKWSGKTVIQQSITNLKKGDKFKKGETLCYNPKFFKSDALAPKNSIFSMQTLARVAFVEGGDVYEDSVAISGKFSNKLNAEVAHIRNIILDLTQDITGLVNVGDKVSPDSILCTILNTQTDSSFYDADTLALLEKIASTSPKAKYEGIVEKIDAIYTGDVDTMPDGVKEVVIASDRDIYRTSKKLGEPISNGLVDIGFRVDGKSLPKNTTAIRVHIRETLSMGTGDKLVLGNQLKGTVARVWTDVNATEDGAEFDAYFSGYSVDNRVVNSPFLVGTTSTLLLAITERACDLYFS